MRQLSNTLSAKHIPASASIPLGKFSPLTAVLVKVKDFDHLFLNDFLPALPKPRYVYIQCLGRNGLPSPVVLMTYSLGNNAWNLHFVWKVPTESPAEECFHKSLTTIEQVKPLLPQFHTRAMRQAMFEKFSRVSPNVKPAVLRLFYKDLTGDCSASHDLPEPKVDNRVREMLSMEIEDPNTVVNLWEMKNTELRTRFEHFWSKAEKYINEDLGVAIDNRRHGDVTHLAKAISIRDLKEQVSLRWPSGAAIPSEKWLRLRFWPKTPKAHVS